MNRLQKIFLGVLAILLLGFGFITDYHPYDYVACFLGGGCIGFLID